MSVKFLGIVILTVCVLSMSAFAVQLNSRNKLYALESLKYLLSGPLQSFLTPSLEACKPNTQGICAYLPALFHARSLSYSHEKVSSKIGG